MMATELVSACWRRFSPGRAATPRGAARLRQAAIRPPEADPLRVPPQAGRDRGQYHLGRARRAKDHGRYDAAIREIERALRFDDTSEAFYQVLAQCYLKRPEPDPPAARRALEHAFALNPRSSFTLELLLRLCEQTGDLLAAAEAVQVALAAGAPAYWRAAVDRLAGRARREVPVA